MYPWLSRLQIKYSHLNNPAYWQKAHTLADKKRMNFDGNGSSVDCVGVCTSYSEMSDLPIVITYFSECKSRGVQNENGVGSFQGGWKSKWIQFRFSFKSSRSNGKTTMAKSKENWITGTYQEKVSLLLKQFRGQTSTLSGVATLITYVQKIRHLITSGLQGTYPQRLRTCLVNPDESWTDIFCNSNDLWLNTW